MRFILTLTAFSALATRLDVRSSPWVFAITHKSRSVQIFGRFEVLRNGITLVDLPGHGDTNNERCLFIYLQMWILFANSNLHDSNQLAEEYLKRADCILLGQLTYADRHHMP
jgi:hypothetical protein